MILTCSMARDADLFAILARSVDAFVDPAIPHRVVVPRRDMARFAPFANARRQIVAQEDVLPVRFLRLPAAPRALSRIAGTLRRPLYLDRRFRLVRGWILQQLLKIEVARTASEDMVLHVDSDVFFFRRVAAADLFEDGRPRFFRVADGAAPRAEHAVWTSVARAMLGLPDDTPATCHYVENCIPWSTAAVRGMVRTMEAAQPRLWADTVLGARTFSEYFLYGVHADSPAGMAAADGAGNRESGSGGAGLAGSDRSLCLSWWPTAGGAGASFAIEAQLARVRDGHVAMAVQSTEALDPDARAAAWRAACAWAAAAPGNRPPPARTDAAPDTDPDTGAKPAGTA
jgi:hypothetical protein